MFTDLSKLRSRTCGGRATAAVLAAGLTLAGCGSDASPATQTGDQVPSVLAAFYPFEFVASRVGGDDAIVEGLTKPGAEPHNLELTPQQVGSVAEADLVVYLAGFQPAVDEAVEQNAPAAALEVTTVVPLEVTGEGDEPGHGDEEHENEEHSDDEHGNETAGDPHIWLDPNNLAIVATAVAERLAETNPDAADGYAQRAEELVGELDALDEEFQDGLATCERREFVTNHAAFGYLAAAYDLEPIAISGLSPETEPSPARIAEVQELIEVHEITTIFYETLVSPKVAETMADDLGVQTAVLDPLEGLVDEDQDYLGVMRANLAALRAANGCT